MSQPLLVPCPHCQALNRVPADKLAETLEFAAEEGRTASNFVRRVYLIGLEQYRKAQQPQGVQA